MKLKELPKEFERKGVRYTCLERNLYDVTDADGNPSKDGYLIYKCESIEFGNVYFEVFRYRTAKPHPHSNEDYDLVELYPTDNVFGLYAWACSNLECVEKVMRKHFEIDYDIKNIQNLLSDKD